MRSNPWTGPLQRDVLWVNIRNSLQSIKKHPSQITAFNAEGDVSNPVLHFGNGICQWQGFQVMRIILATVDKMSIATL